MIRHPSLYFIKYLMTQDRPEAQDDTWITSMVGSLGYPKPHRDFLSFIRGTLQIPANFQPKNRYHRESAKFLRQEGIWSLHNPDAAAREATLLVTNLRVRPTVEQLLLGHLDPKEIAKKVNSRFSEFLTVGAIEAYEHYYWNVDLLRVEEWAVLLDGYELNKHRSLAILQVGPAMALHMAGFQQNIESKTILKDMLETLYFDFRDWKTQPRSEERTKALALLAKSATVIDERLSQADTAMRDSLKAFEQFRMQHAQMEVQDIRKIAPDGNFSGSGAKLLEPVVAKREV